MTRVVAKTSGLVLALCAWGAVGCAWFASPKIEGSGRAIEDRRAVDGFSAVEFRGALTGDIAVGEPFAVMVKGDDNLVSLVRTTVSNGRLVVDTKDKVELRPRAGLAVSVRLPKLARAEAHGACDLRVVGTTGPQLQLEASGASRLVATGLTGDQVSVGVSGASRVVVGGGVGKLAADLSGASHLEARELTARTAEVEVSGASHAEVTGREAVSGSASGASNVKVWGNPPKLAVETSGASSVKSMP